MSEAPQCLEFTVLAVNLSLQYPWVYGYLCAPRTSSDRDNDLRSHRETPGTSAKLKANLCPRSTGGSTHCGHGLMTTSILFEVMQQDGAPELLTVPTPPALCEVPHQPWPLRVGCSSGCDKASCATPQPQVPLHSTAQAPSLCTPQP